MAIVILWSIGCVFAFAFQCIPARALWEPELEASGQAKCVNTTALFLSSGIIHILLDFTILVLPLQPIWKLRLSSGRKVALSGLFMLGTL